MIRATQLRRNFFAGLAFAGIGLSLSTSSTVLAQSASPDDWQTGNPAWTSAGLPAFLPANLPTDLLLNPIDADLYWVERWDSNDFWANPDVWQNPQDILNHPDVAASGLGFDFLFRYRWIFRDDNYQHALANGFIADAFDDLGLPGHVPAGYALREIERELGQPQLIPNSAGTRAWVFAASDTFPGGGNDNIDVTGTFTIGELTVQNSSNDSGRSFRGGGTIIMDSGDPLKNARFVLLGTDREITGHEVADGLYDNWSDDVNFRAGTNLQLNSNLEMYLLAEVGAPRFRLRGSSRITGTGDLIINPGNAADYADTGSGNVGQIRRELRVEDSGRIATFGDIYINAARVRLGRDNVAGESADIINTSGIFIGEEGQLRLDRRGTVVYDLNHAGGAVITINSAGHLMDDDSNGAIRQHGREDPTFSNLDIATIRNDIVVAGDSRIHARNQSTLILEGDITGPGEIRKTGEGFLVLKGNNSFGGTVVGNGTLTIDSADALPVGPLRFANRDNTRTLNLFGSHVVTSLDGSAPDPAEPGSSNNLVLNLGPAGTSFTVNQAIFFDSEGDEDSTRFQGDIAGAGDFIKDGDGVLRFTRWAKTYTGATIINQGVLEVSESAALADTSGITVNSGGQLRLSTNGTPTYSFGGVLTLDSLGRSGNVMPGQGMGIRGGLRQDPGGDDHDATLTNDIVIAGDSGIHVNNATNSLTLTGSITGAADLVKSGGGGLILTGNNAGFSGHVVVENGLFVVDGGSVLGTGSITVDGGAFVGAGEIVFGLGSSPQQITLLDGVLDVSAMTINFSGSADLSEYTLIDYSAGGFLVTGSNSLTDNTFFNALNIPTGFEFVNNTTTQQLLLTSVAAPLPGDFNLDGVVDADDIDLLFGVLGTSVPPTDPIFDLTGSGQIDHADLNELVLNILGTQFGDANLDGTVDDDDLAIVQANLGNASAGWAGGNFNGIGGTTLYDAYLLFQNYSPTVTSTSTVIPEPAGVLVLGLGGLSLLARRRRG